MRVAKLKSSGRSESADLTERPPWLSTVVKYEDLTVAEQHKSTNQAICWFCERMIMILAIALSNAQAYH